MIAIPDCCAMPEVGSGVYACITCGSQYVRAGGGWVLAMIATTPNQPIGPPHSWPLGEPSTPKHPKTEDKVRAACPDRAEHHLMESCGSCGYVRTPRVHPYEITLDADERQGH